MTTTFKVGDIVCFASKFLHDCGWYTEVPLNGQVLEIRDGGYGNLLQIHWCDHVAPTLVHSSNVILFDERHLEPR